MAMTPTKGWSISALAVELGRDRRTIASIVGGLQSIGREGKADLYRLTDVLPLLMAGGKTSDFDDAKARKMAAEAELAEIELAKARGEMVSVTEAAKLVAEEYAAVRSKLLSLPSKLGPMLAIEDTETACRALLSRGINEALNELVSRGDESGAVEGPPRSAEAATGADGERVGGLLSQAFL